MTYCTLTKRPFLHPFLIIIFYKARFFMARMKIFNTSEQNAYELPPTFNSLERKKYFTPPVAFKELIEALNTPTNKVCFLVTAGYFKSRQRFFSRQFNQKDIEYAAKQLDVCINDVQLNTYSKVTY